MKKKIIATMSIMAATVLITGCNQKKVEPEVVSTYHLDKRNQEVRNTKIQSISLEDGILKTKITGVTYSPEYAINYNLIEKQKCKKVWNPVLNMEIPDCKTYYEKEERKQDGHVYTDKYFKTTEGLKNKEVDVKIIINDGNQTTEVEKELKTDDNGTVKLNIKKVVFTKVKEPKEVKVEITSMADKTKKYKATMDEKELVILKAQYNQEVAEAKAKAKREAKAKAEAEKRAKIEAEKQAKIEAALKKAKAEREAKAKAEREAKKLQEEKEAKEPSWIVEKFNKITDMASQAIDDILE